MVAAEVIVIRFNEKVHGVMQCFILDSIWATKIDTFVRSQ